MVVGRGGDQAAAAAEHPRLDPGVVPRGAHLDHRPAGAEAVQRGQPRRPVVLDPEGGVGHAERAEDPLGEELVERLPGGDLDHAAEDVGGDAVVPLRARLEQQRQRRPAVARRRQVHAPGRAGVEAGRAVDRVDRVHPVEPVGEPGGVGEQVPDPHRLGGRDRERVLVRAAGVDAQVGEGRDELADRVGQLQRALLVQHHRGDRGDRLGHREDAPEGVGFDRETFLAVAGAVAGHVRELAVPAHRDQVAGQPPVVDVAGEGAVDPPQPFRVEPYLGRVDLRLESAH